jgi:hypothetical protein
VLADGVVALSQFLDQVTLIELRLLEDFVHHLAVEEDVVELRAVLEIDEMVLQAVLRL